MFQKKKEKKKRKKNGNEINNFALCDREKKLFISFLFFLKYFLKN